MLLGLDIGTTKIAAVIADPAGRLLAVASAEHHAGLAAPAGRAEQDANVLLEVLWRTVCDLPADLRRQVRAVGLTGQMHGVLLLDAAGRPVSPLVTWQDQRCLEDGFLEKLVARTGRPISTGFGCATMAWLAAHGQWPRAAASAGTIHDWAAMKLCGQPRPVTDPTNAASWGFFHLRTLAWDVAAVQAASVDPALLPEVRPCGSLAGTVAEPVARELGLPPGLPVAVALGDNQASLLATLGDPEHEIALTLGTGGQASAVLPAGETIEDSAAPEQPFGFRPYPGGRYLIAATPLCGGSAWVWLARTVNAWQRELGLPEVPEEALYAKLNDLGVAAADGPQVAPHFLGERHAPTLRGSITQLGFDGLPLGQLARGLARGIVANLRDMLPPRALVGRTRLVGSGNALRRNRLLQVMAEETFGLPLVLSQGREEAAVGAALNARALAK